MEQLRLDLKVRQPYTLDISYLFDELASTTPSVYNWGPTSFAEAVTRHVNLTEDCTNKPGKLLGYEELCDPSICEKTTNVLDGDLGKLTFDEN
ncbi:hypothetical protein SLS60_008989 [Paraconiothyrium brasiliense]|uniref:Uncharacterized protein n=1 Tax=Paraconiothyrium brasiliense TaxID=300254 RepID=A0ABR3QVZ8_9PLEO